MGKTKKRSLKKIKKTKMKYKKNRYTRKIGGTFTETKAQMQTLLENPEDRYAMVLNKVCGPATRWRCLDFGVYRNGINKFFNNLILIKICNI